MKSSKSRFDLNFNMEDVVGDFQSMSTQPPGDWGAAPKLAVLLLIFIAVLVAAFFLLLKGQVDYLKSETSQTEVLKKEFVKKYGASLQVDALKEQMAQANRELLTLLKRLPGRTEMETLLIDINQLGVGRGLEFKLFKPGKESNTGLYVELPISVKLSGTYHNFSAFVADIARLPRIVTIGNLKILTTKRASQESGISREKELIFDFTIGTFRTPDAEETKDYQPKKRGGNERRQR